MQLIKRISLLSLAVMLMFTACSKDEDKNSKNTKNKPDAANVVDMGEDDGEKTPSKKVDAKKNTDKKKNKQEADLPPEEIARRNAAAGIDENGNPKRGKPAAQLDAEEKEAKAKGAKGHEPKKPEPKAEEAPADAAADGFDFADENNAADANAEEPKEEPITERIVQKRVGLNIENLITVKELRELTGYSGAIEQTDLPGQASDARYNVIRLSTSKKSELGFSLQVWKPANEQAASKKYDEMFKQSFGGVKQKDIANDAFIAVHHNINEICFYDKGKRAVVMISCSNTVCKKDSLKGLATTVQRRL